MVEGLVQSQTPAEVEVKRSLKTKKTKEFKYQLVTNIILRTYETHRG